MKLNQFRDVVAIAERGSLRAAARHLQLAQPALTRSVQELERELGAPLFERRARGMILTPMGQAFVRRASAVLTEVRRARDEVEQLHGGTAGKVVAGLSLAAHIALLPKALAPFRARYPQVELHLIEGWYPTLETGLKDGSVDFYVGPRPDQQPSSELIQEPLFENLRIIFGRKGHPLAGARSLRDLAGAEWATTSVTFKAEEELGELVRAASPAAAAAGAAQSVRADLDDRARVQRSAWRWCLVQWTDFSETSDTLKPILVKEALPGAADRDRAPLGPAAHAGRRILA